MKQFCLGLILLVFLGWQIDTSKANEVQFNIRIREKGSRFNEKIKINEKENTVSFEVPKHNAANRSDVLNDFNLKLTITRLPDARLCTIKPLERGLPNPRKMKSDMDYIKNARPRGSGKNMLVTSSSWTFDKRVKEKDLHPSISKFCAGFPVYRLVEIPEDTWKMVGNDTANTKKRNFVWTLCPNTYQGKKCNPNTWVLNCGFRPLGTCVYWMNCEKELRLVTNVDVCKFTHTWSSVVCCTPTC